MTAWFTRIAQCAWRLARAAVLTLTLLTCAMTPLTAGDATRGEEPAGTWASDSSASISLTFPSRYVWRGLLVTDGPVAQPVVEVEHRGFFVNVWGNMDLLSPGIRRINLVEVKDLVIGAGQQPGRNPGRLDGILDDSFQARDDPVEVDLIAQGFTEGFHCAGGIVPAAIKTAVDKILDEAPDGDKESHDHQG